MLGQIKYNQGQPYNKMCPIITEYIIQNGDTTKNSYDPATGCTQTAEAMIMRYWKHPKRPTGKKTYKFDYKKYINKDSIDAEGNEKVTYAKDSLSIDFDHDSVPDYDWDNMIPRYETIERTSDEALRAKQDTAVARLMAHLGISNGAGYGHSTGAALRMDEMAKYFGYAKDYIEDSYSNWKTKGDDAYRAMLADELSQGRPIWAAGSGENGGGHSYVIDGYDMNALFHFNLGWNGGSNGWYEVAPVPKVPYGLGMWFKRHIHPEGRLTPTEPTRRVVIEVGGGGWNRRYKVGQKNIKTLDVENKYGETIIPIITAETEEDADNYLPGLGSIQGVLFDRCDTLTGTASVANITSYYQAHVNTPANALIDIDAIYTSEETMKVNVGTEFNQSITNADYRISFVYTEDGVKIDGEEIPYLMRGSYKAKENCLPATIEQDKEYIYEDEIPLPASISNTDNTTLIVMLIDGKTGAIANANTLDLKQINTWKANNKPAFYNEGKLQETTSSTTIYGFDEENSRMEIPVRINNPWYQAMSVEVRAEATDVAENAQMQLGETEGVTKVAYQLPPLTVDSTMMLYLNITDKFQSSLSTVKLILRQNSKKVAEQIVNFDYIKNLYGVNPYTVRIKGTLESLIPQEVKDTMTAITLGGRLCGNDISYLSNCAELNLKKIDMSETKIVEGPGNYNKDYNNTTTKNDIIGTRMFEKFNIEEVILPNSATTIESLAFNLNSTIKTVVVGENTTSIGDKAFYKCTALEKITISANVTKIGTQTFMGSGLKYVICQRETPATLGSFAFTNVDFENATLVVPSEAAVTAYKAAKQWKDFGTIITKDQYTTNIAQIAEKTGVSVKNGKIVVENDAEVAIYTFAGKLVAAGKAGEYTLPKGNYIVKVGNSAVKVRL